MWYRNHGLPLCATVSCHSSRTSGETTNTQPIPTPPGRWPRCSFSGPPHTLHSHSEPRRSTRASTRTSRAFDRPGPTREMGGSADSADSVVSQGFTESRGSPKSVRLWWEATLGARSETGWGVRSAVGARTLRPQYGRFRLKGLHRVERSLPSGITGRDCDRKRSQPSSDLLLYTLRYIYIYTCPPCMTLYHFGSIPYTSLYHTYYHTRNKYIIYIYII